MYNRGHHEPGHPQPGHPEPSQPQRGLLEPGPSAECLLDTFPAQRQPGSAPNSRQGRSGRFIRTWSAMRALEPNGDATSERLARLLGEAGEKDMGVTKIGITDDVCDRHERQDRSSLSTSRSISSASTLRKSHVDPSRSSCRGADGHGVARGHGGPRISARRLFAAGEVP